MARLPTPGSDNGTWGQVLNDFLAVAHTTSGTIKPNAVDSSAIQDNSISGAKLQDNSVTSDKLTSTGGTDGQVLTKNSGIGGGLEWTSVVGSPDATTSSKGIVQLAGDLGGTATSPTVPGLASKANTSTTVSAGTGLTGGGDLSANRTLSANFGTTSGTIAQGNHTHTLTFSLTSFFKTGTLAVITGTQRLPIDGTYTVVGTRLTVGTAPTGASLIVDIHKNGTTIYTTQANRPTITAAANAGGPGATPDVTTLAAGDYLTVDIDQVGSSVAGADLTVAVIVTKTV